MLVERQPWERQPGESTPAIEAFRKYLDLGPDRSIRRADQDVDKRQTLLGKRSKRWKWPARIEAWDVEDARVYAEERRQASRRIGRQSAKIAGAMLAVAVRRLQSLDPEKLAARDLAVFIKTAVDLERQ